MPWRCGEPPGRTERRDEGEGEGPPYRRFLLFLCQQEKTEKGEEKKKTHALDSELLNLREETAQESVEACDRRIGRLTDYTWVETGAKKSGRKRREAVINANWSAMGTSFHVRDRSSERVSITRQVEVEAAAAPPSVTFIKAANKPT